MLLVRRKKIFRFVDALLIAERREPTKIGG
jgi:hypothetical protein